MYVTTWSLAVGTASSAPDHTVQVAFITAIGVVIAGLLTALATFFKKDEDEPQIDYNFVQNYIVSLLADRTELQKIRADYETLRDAVWAMGTDPDTLINPAD